MPRKTKDAPLSLWIMVKRFVSTFTHPKTGEEISVPYVTRISATPQNMVKDGGSAFLGFVDLVFTLAGVPMSVTGLVAGIRADGQVYLTSKDEARQDSWVGNDGKRRDGKKWIEPCGFDAQEAFFNAVAEFLPELRKREKTARAIIAKRAA